MKAFESHSGCYLEPYEGAPSICDLSFRDWLQVVATVKYALDWRVWKLGVLQQNVEIISEGLNVFLSCPKDDSNVTTIKIVFKTKSQTSLINSVYTVTDQILDLITTKYGTDDLLVYPYISDTDRKKRAVQYTGDVNVHVVMAHRSEYDLNFQQGKTIDMEKAVDYFLDKVSAGEFRPKLTEGVELKTYAVCDEVKCQNVNRTVEQPIVSSADRCILGESTVISAFALIIYFRL